MTGVKTIARDLLRALSERQGIKRIARELGIARDTIRKVLRSGATEFIYKRAQPAVTPTTDAKARCPSPPRRCPTDSPPKQPRLARREKASDRRAVIPGCL